ncbi:YybH family protein [Rubrivirga marina]|uniref:DUF4440 domain-containing protein n=1 Tax=Rubrivirga marina TaxID=1196024 RepID=A0A271J1J5_9BACT|nr:DUF4440 domain-containing protein [Rubrivirga marina]PAP77230.1 hypothetical protein BSZ37_12695 [Rubrivirga marina]
MRAPTLHWFLAAALGLGLASCDTASPGPAPATPADVRTVIHQTNDRLERWYAAGQIDSAAAVFAADTWQMPPNAAPLVGREAYHAFWSQAVQWGTWQFDLDAQDVVVADSIAVERGAYTMHFEAGPGAPFPAFADEGNYVVLWRLEADGAWRIVWDAPVSVLPPGAAPASE